MDRNVFALIAGTVFLLFIINAVVQMQTAMVREAAQGVGDEYSEATWETAGVMYMLSNDEAYGFGKYTDGSDVDSLVEQSGNACVMDEPYFQGNNGPLELGFYGTSSVDSSTECSVSGYVRSVPLKIGTNEVQYVGVECQGCQN